MAQEQIVLITGINPDGLGLHTARALLSSLPPNSTIILTSRSVDKAESVANTLEEDGVGEKRSVKLVTLELDLDNDESIAKVVTYLEKLGRLDVLIHNASEYPTNLSPSQADISPAANLDMKYRSGDLTIRQAFDQSLGTNVTSTYVLTEALLPVLYKSDLARIMFISSSVSSASYHSFDMPINHPPLGDKGVWPKTPTFDLLTYRTSKTALNMMFLEWCRILKVDQEKIKLFLVCPGYLATNLGGLPAHVHRQYGAEEPGPAGEFIKDISTGVHDEKAGTFFDKKGTIPW
jgi:NAD(P)-dependent dehydrogenase (short-subunit alcohol dehydrogenase family)